MMMSEWLPPTPPHIADTLSIFKIKKMKLKLIIAIGILAINFSFGQINYHEFGQVFPDDVMFVEDIGPHEKLEDVKDSIKQELMVGFRKTDINSIKELLSPKLQNEVLVMDSLLNSYEVKFNSVDSVYLFENSGYAVGLTGTIAITKFSNKSIGNLSMEYQYYCPRGKTIVNRISINGIEFPSELITISKLRSKIQDRELSDKEKFDTYHQLLQLISTNDGERYNDFYIPESNGELSRLNGNLSWHALIIGENAIAVSAAKKGLSLNPSNLWINTNLALGLAQNDRLDEAILIYTKLMNEPYRDKTFQEVFLADIEAVESRGIEVKNKEKIIEILSKE